MVSSIEPVLPREPSHAAVPMGRPVRRRVVASPQPSGEVALAIRASELLRARGGGAPAAWLVPGFARAVDLVRRQLGPLRDRRMLVASYERESHRLAMLRRLAADPAAGQPAALEPLEAAYTVRWLELGGGETLPSWTAFIRAEVGPRGDVTR